MSRPGPEGAASAAAASAEPPRPGDLFIGLACVGMVWGWAEVVVVAIRKLVFHRPVWLGEQIVWMTPLAAGAVAVLAALIPVALLWRLSPPWAARGAVFAASFAGAWSLLSVAAPGIKGYGRILLAAGVAVQLAIFLGPRLAAGPGRLRGMAGRLVLLVGALWMVVNPGRSLVERIRASRLPAPAASRPNILLITFDTERAQSLSMYGNQRPTSPSLERLAQGGVRFERAYATSSWTLPSHGSLFTGRQAHELSAAWLVPLDDRYPTLAESLRRAGYLTAGFVANTFYCGRDFGLSRGFLHYEDYVATPQELLVSLGAIRRVLNSWTFRRVTGFGGVLTRKRSADVNRAFLAWLDRRGSSGTRPFFAFLNYNDPHEPYAPPPPYDAMFGRRVAPDHAQAGHKLRDASLPDRRRRAMQPAKVQEQLDAYEGAIAYADAQLGALVDGLARRGILDRTLLVVTSDHGEQFREHRRASDSLSLSTHGNSLYAQALWVPLVIVYPARVPAGVSIDTPVSLRDIPATVATLSAALAADSFPGQTLSSLWEGEPTGEPPSLPISSVIAYDAKVSPKGRITSAVVNDYHYIRYGSGEIEVFNHRLDPAESKELRGALERTPEGRGLLDSLARVLQGAIGGGTGRGGGAP